jgi:hypothetical protein
MGLMQQGKIVWMNSNQAARPLNEKQVLYLSGNRTDHGLDFGNAVGGKPALCGMLTDHDLTGSDIDAIDLIVCYKALNPLDLCSHLVQNLTGLLRNPLQFFLGQLPRFRNFTLNNKLWHRLTPLRLNCCSIMLTGFRPDQPVQKFSRPGNWRLDRQADFRHNLRRAAVERHRREGEVIAVDHFEPANFCEQKRGQVNAPTRL